MFIFFLKQDPTDSAAVALLEVAEARIVELETELARITIEVLCCSLTNLPSSL